MEVIEKPGDIVSPHVIKNETGHNVTLRLDDTFAVWTGIDL